VPSHQHQKLVGNLVNWIKQEGFEIRCANYDDYLACDKWQNANHIPDARGYRNDIELWCLGESKRADDDAKSSVQGIREFRNASWKVEGSTVPLISGAYL
jgi:hypothetical protein